MKALALLGYYIRQICTTPHAQLLISILISSQIGYWSVGILWQICYLVGYITVLLMVRALSLSAILIMIIGVSIGYLSAQNALEPYQQSQFAVEEYSGSTKFYGVIISEPKRKYDDRASFEFRITKVGDMDVNAFKAYVSARDIPLKQYGNSCEINGHLGLPEIIDSCNNLESGKGGGNANCKFDFISYLKQRGIGANLRVENTYCENATDDGGYRADLFVIFRQYLIKIREKIVDRIEYSLPEPQSSLLAGILFGIDRVFTDEFADRLQITGTTHIIAASGYNINLVISLVYVWVGRLLTAKYYKFRLASAFVGVWIFAIIAGLSGSVVRAASMGSIVLMRKFLGLDLPLWYLVLLILTVISVFSPGLLSQLGFLLSLSATLGLNMLSGGESSDNPKRKGKSKFRRAIEEYLMPTIWATLATTPILVLNFGRFSLIGIISNLLVLPVLESSMLVGALAIVASFATGSGSYITQLLFGIVYAQLSYFEYICDVLSKLEFMQIEVSSELAIYISLAIYLFGAVYFLNLQSRNDENKIKL